MSCTRDRIGSTSSQRRRCALLVAAIGLLPGRAGAQGETCEPDRQLQRTIYAQRAAICQALQRRGIALDTRECMSADLAIPDALRGKLCLPIGRGYQVVCQKGNSPPLAPDTHAGALRYSLDLSEGPRSRPIPITAPAAGTAYVYGGARDNKPDNWGFGNIVLVDHHNGYASLLCHLREITVANGAQVGQGQTVGTLGKTGNAGNEHLHFQVSRLTRTPDPAREQHHDCNASTVAPPFGQSVPVDLGVQALSTQYRGRLDSRFFVGSAAGQAWDIAHVYAAP